MKGLYVFWIIITLILTTLCCVEIALLFGGAQLRLAHPGNLWLLFLLLVIIIGGIVWLLWQKKTSSNFGKSTIIYKLIYGNDLFLSISRFVMLSLGIGMVILSLARPQGGGHTRLLRKKGIDIVIALDFSKSMLAKDVAPSRIERAEREISTLLKLSPGDRIGVVAFSGETISFPLTTDGEAVNMFLRDLHPYDMPVGGTAIGKAIISGIRLLTDTKQSEKRMKVIILITDGEDHEGDPVEAAKEASKSNIKIYTLGIGSEIPELIPMYFEDKTYSGYQKDENGNYITTKLSPENEKVLREISKISGGIYIKAPRGGIGIENIRKELDKLRKHELKVKPIEMYEEMYIWFLWPGFLMILVATLMPLGIRRKE